MIRKANAVWRGAGRDGDGDLTTPSGVLSSTPYSFHTRFEDAPGTNPEELIAAAHAGCFTMALAFQLQAAGFTPTELRTEAAVTLEKDGDGFRISRSALTLEADVPGLEYAQIFRNAGPEAGASIEHLHSQLIAVPFVPSRPAGEAERVTAFHDRTGSCLTCRLLDDELAAGTRIILTTPRFVVLAPHAARCPYETWIVPRHHAASLAQADESLLRELADVSRRIVGRMEDYLVRPSYNMVLVGAPLKQQASAAWHWRIELFPRLTYQAGFEWGTGCYINPIPPEEAANQLRQFTPEPPSARGGLSYAGFAGTMTGGS